ncbi:PspC domain-containing protein [Mesonia sp. K4-1]|nr:PspC domain-containing protein [Mesonia sp. K4-1]
MLYLLKSNFMVSSIRYYFERNGFYVSSRFADRLGMKVKSVRLFFIYLSFATLGIGFAVYLTLAFWLKLKDLVYTKRTSVFDL